MKRQWWHNKIFYQIYPKSFCDSNGDGIGDIPGIISKLDYIRSLGVDLIWLSPVYKSPFQDQGYDIADYLSIDPVFGAMEDMERLIAEAKKRGMGILMDLVVNHCSDEHEWFQRCIEDPEGPYGKYFYLSPPNTENNLRACFGGSVWSPLPGNPGYSYLHTFDKKQPDLNWENPQVREEIYDMVNWWLDKGLAGFRIDAIMNIKKVLPFHDYEPDRTDGMCGCGRMVEEAELRCGGVHAFLNELKERCFAPHHAFSVGEVFDADREKLKTFIGEDGHFSSMFDFAETCLGKDTRGWWQAEQRIAPDVYRDTVFHSQEAAGEDCFFSNIIENHDEPRGVSHYLSAEAERTPEGKKLLACMYYLLRGLPFVYQGQELGMQNVPFASVSAFNDISTLDEYKTARRAGQSEAEALRTVCAFSRDNARTPMQWSAEKNAGFTSGTPWLAVSPDYTAINAADEENNPGSVLNFYRALAALRKHPLYEETFVYGAFTPVLTEVSGLMAYLRGSANGDERNAAALDDNASPTICVLGNFNAQSLDLQALCAGAAREAQPSTSEKSCAAAEKKLTDALQKGANVLLNNYPDFDGTLKPYQAVVLALD